MLNNGKVELVGLVINKCRVVFPQSSIRHRIFEILKLQITPKLGALILGLIRKKVNL